MVLFAVAGYLLERLAGWNFMVVPMVLVGFAVANVIPTGRRGKPDPASPHP